MAVRSGARPTQAHTYRLPELLADIRLLDLLELSGSMRQASQLLQLSQPSVSRRYRSLAEDFGLTPTAAVASGCRYGNTRTMQLLRRSCRCHRLEAGVARLGSDPIHAALLAGAAWLLPSPIRFQSVQRWLDLVREGVLDGALLSELELEVIETPDLSQLELHRVGALPLALTVAKKAPERQVEPAWEVLVPDAGVAPGLRSWLRQRGWALRSAGTACVSQGQWLEKLRGDDVAMLIGLADQADPCGWESLNRIALQPPAQSMVWLALPRGSSAEPLLRHTLEHLRKQLALTC